MQHDLVVFVGTEYLSYDIHPDKPAVIRQYHEHASPRLDIVHWKDFSGDVAGKAIEVCGGLVEDCVAHVIADSLYRGARFVMVHPDRVIAGSLLLERRTETKLEYVIDNVLQVQWCTGQLTGFSHMIHGMLYIERQGTISLEQWQKKYEQREKKF